MSNLRDRLKKIAAERKDAPQAAPAPRADPAPRLDPAPRAVCAQIVREAEIPPLRLSANALALMGGEAFSGLRLAPEDLLFLDTETTGLSGGVGTIAFEVGVGEVLGEKMRITQLYLRDYDEEEDALSAPPEPSRQEAPAKPADPKAARRRALALHAVRALRRRAAGAGAR